MKRIVFFFASFLFSLPIFAQVLGTSIVNWDFASGIPADWQNNSATGNSQWEYRGPSTTPNNTVLSRGSCAAGTAPPSSTTLSNGFLIYDSNYWDDPGTVCGGALGSGADPAPQQASLITAPINLSAYPGASITFQQQYWHFNTTTKIQVSIDGGNTWTDVFTNSAYLSTNVEWATANISTIAGNQPDVRFKFVFDGYYYWWAIDDITVYAPSQNDVIMGNPRFTTNGNAGIAQFQDMEYDQYPATMLTPFQFSGSISNIGTNSQSGVALRTKVLNISNTELYNSVTAGYAMAPAEARNYTQATPYTPSTTAGEYRITYEALQSQTDSNNSNNRDTLDFSVTPFTYARDEGPMEDRFIPATNFNNSPLKVGNVFESRNSGLAFRSMAVGLANGTEIGSQIKGYVYKEDLVTLLGETDPYTVNLADINQVGQEKMIVLDLISPIILDADSTYLVMVGSLDGSQPMRIARAGEAPVQASLVNYPAENEWYYLLKTPLVRMNVFYPALSPGCNDVTAMNYETWANLNDGSCRYPGCTIEGSTNYNPNANFDDASCVLEGCTDPTAVNFNPNANSDDNSCLFGGCTIPTANNYDPNADVDDGSCIIPGCTNPISDNYNPIATIDNGSCTFNILGCTNPLADNYNPNATVDNGSCQYLGCTDVHASNYEATANTNDGSCEYIGCTIPSATNFNQYALVDDGSCIVYGCMNSFAFNYNPLATIDDGTCIIYGCTNVLATNYNPSANADDGSCTIYGCMDPSADNFDPQANTSAYCIYYGCNDPEAINFDSQVNTNDGSCLYTQAHIELSNNAGCFPLHVDVYNQTINSEGSNCQYLLDGVLIGVTCVDTFSLDLAEPGTYQITYSVTNAQGLTSSDMRIITVYAHPQVPLITYSTSSNAAQCINVIVGQQSVYWTLNGTPLSTEISISGPSNGLYQATLTDQNGCESQSAVLPIALCVFEPSSPTSGCAPLTVHFENFTSYVEGMTTTIDFGDGTVFGATPDMALTHEYTAAGTYTAVLTGALNGVEYPSINAVEVYPSFTPVLSSSQPLSCVNCTPDMTLVWTVNGTISDYTGIGPHDFGPDSMLVELSATTIQGCEGHSSTIVDSVYDISKPSWTVYPNPANDNVAIRGGSGVIRVRNPAGNLIHINLVKSSSGITLDCSEWASGIYLIEIQDNNTTKTSKIVILH